MEIHEKGLENIRFAIVMAAVKEYSVKYRLFLRLKNKGASITKMNNVKGDLRALERFFRSEWFELLCDIDPEFIIRTIQNDPAAAKRLAKSSTKRR